MKRLTVYCEGQTEEMVVQRVLRPHLQLHGVQDVRPVLAANSLEPEGRRGGFVNWDAIEFDLRQIFVDTTHPAARIEAAIPGYCNLKASNAFFVLQEAGLDVVRSRCPRFDGWLRLWETWGGI